MSAHTTRNGGDRDEFVTVSIYDQTYYLRGEDPAYIERLAGLVDTRMSAVAAHGSTADSLRVAVLAALNIADELAMANARLEAVLNADQDHRTRAHSLTGLLDEVLLDGAAQGASIRRAG